MGRHRTHLDDSRRGPSAAAALPRSSALHRATTVAASRHRYTSDPRTRPPRLSPAEPVTSEVARPPVGLQVLVRLGALFHEPAGERARVRSLLGACTARHPGGEPEQRKTGRGGSRCGSTARHERHPLRTHSRAQAGTAQCRGPLSRRRPDGQRVGAAPGDLTIRGRSARARGALAAIVWAAVAAAGAFPLAPAVWRVHAALVTRPA